jgi:hypothetical protein
MGLDQPGNDVDAVLFEALGFQQHLVGLAHPGTVSQIDLELSTLRSADQPKKTIGAIFNHGLS